MSKKRTQAEIDWIKERWAFRSFMRGSQWTAEAIEAMQKTERPPPRAEHHPPPGAITDSRTATKH